MEILRTALFLQFLRPRPIRVNTAPQHCSQERIARAPFVPTHTRTLRTDKSANYTLRTPKTTKDRSSPLQRKHLFLFVLLKTPQTTRSAPPNNKDRQQRKLRRNTQTNNTTIETKLCVATIHHKPKSRSANAKLPHAKCLTKLEIQQPHGCRIHKNVMCWRPHRPCGRRTTLTTKAAQQNHQYTRHCTNCAHRASTFN